MTDGFVGFRPLAKKPEGTSPRKFRVQVTLDRDVSEVYTILTTQAGIDQVLDETTRFDARHGGRLRFISAGDEGYGGTYSSLRVGKRVIILTEAHGELDFKLKKVGSGTSVDLRSSKLLTDEEVATWQRSIEAVAHSLEGAR